MGTQVSFEDSLGFPNPNVAVKMPIMPIPTIHIIIPIPVVFSPRILPLNINKSKGLIKHTNTPDANNAYCQLLIVTSSSKAVYTSFD